MDLDALREAVEWWDEHKGFLWQRLHDDDWARIDRSFAAARAVLDSEEAWRCETHKAEGVPLPWGWESDECWRSIYTDVDPDAGLCRVVRVRLLAEEGT